MRAHLLAACACQATALCTHRGDSALSGLAGSWVLRRQSLSDAVLSSLKGAQACAGGAACSAQQRAPPLTPRRAPPARRTGPKIILTCTAVQHIVRKERAVGIIPGAPTIYEVLEEMAITVQQQLLDQKLPFCAFNG